MDKAQFKKHLERIIEYSLDFEISEFESLVCDLIEDELKEESEELSIANFSRVDYTLPKDFKKALIDIEKYDPDSILVDCIKIMQWLEK